MYFLFFSQNLWIRDTSRGGKKTKNKVPPPQAVPAGGCAEARTENRQQTGKIRISTVVAVVLSSDTWVCYPEIACHEPLAPKSWTCFNGPPQLNFPTCIHREGLGNTREAKTKACKLEVHKRLKRFHSPLENHSSSSASPKVESREKWRKKNAGERCQQDHGQISREARRKRKTQETQRRNGGEGPRLVEFSSFTAPKLIPMTTTTTMITAMNGEHDTGEAAAERGDILD